MKALHIAHWDEVHENHESRKYARLLWVLQPNKHDGLGFRRLSVKEDRCELYAGWCLMLQIASKGRKEERGWLVRNGQALGPLDLEVLTGFPRGVFEAAVKYFCEPEVGWLEELDYEANDWARRKPPGTAGESPGTAGQPPENLPTQEGRKEGKKGTEREREKGPLRLEELKLQWVALTKGIKALESREEELDAEERSELVKNRRALARVEKQQREGDFA